MVSEKSFDLPSKFLLTTAIIPTGTTGGKSAETGSRQRAGCAACVLRLFRVESLETLRITGDGGDEMPTGGDCTRFTLSEPYLIGSNLDMIDLSQENKPT